MAESVGSESLSSPAWGLTSAKVAEFRDLLAEERDIALDPEDAWRLARQLVALYRMLMGPIPEDRGVRTPDRMPSGPVERDLVLQ